jgi:hypothetical protein
MTITALFAELDAAIAAASPGERPAMVVQLAARVATLGAALAVLGTPGDEGVALGAEEVILTPAEAVAAIGGNVSIKWLYRHTQGLKFRRNLSRKVIRFEKQGLLRWAAARRA